jgi:tripartite-type tricarboxylate transporter receptor subunit TctC
MSISLGSALPYLKSGQIREMSAWFAVFAPRGTPPELIGSLNQRLQAALDDPKVRQRLLDVGAEPGGGSSESAAERSSALGQVIREAGIKLE